MIYVNPEFEMRQKGWQDAKKTGTLDFDE